MPTIVFRVPAVPVAQPRTRARGFKLANGQVRAQVHDAPKTGKDEHPVHAFKASVRQAFRDAYQGPPLQGAIRLRVILALPRPQKRDGRKHQTDDAYEHTGQRPDKDNLEKSVMDALKGLAWVDDGQVWDGRTSKVVTSADWPPFALVQIHEERMRSQDLVDIETLLQDAEDDRVRRVLPGTPPVARAFAPSSVSNPD